MVHLRARGEERSAKDKMMKVFEAAKAAAAAETKGMMFRQGERQRGGETPKLEALRYSTSLLIAKVGIKHKCIIMLTINTIM